MPNLSLPLMALPHRKTILIEGDDSAHFLEGLVTSALPQKGQVTGSALLTPQGKILFTFLLSLSPSGFVLECDSIEVNDLLKRLSLYKLRAKVTLSIGDLAVFVGGDEGLLDQRHDDLPPRSYQSDRTTAEAGQAYGALRVALGVLEGPEEIVSNGDFPHDVALDLVGAVSFSKGCFVGQEVVSRVKHRGTARRRPVLLQAETIKSGSSVEVGERQVGTVRAIGDGLAIAVVRLDHIKGANTVLVDGVSCNLTLPSYATYELTNKA